MWNIELKSAELLSDTVWNTVPYKYVGEKWLNETPQARSHKGPVILSYKNLMDINILKELNGNSTFTGCFPAIKNHQSQEIVLYWIKVL